MTVLVAALASVVAVQYAVIGLYVVPRLARVADRGGSVIRAGQWGAAAFFLGCGVTHVGIAIHTLSQPAGSAHLLTVHVWPHVAQIVGGATFIYIAWRKLDVSFTTKGFEEQRLRLERERERSVALLAKRAAEQADVAALGQRALGGTEPSRLMHDAARMVRDRLAADQVAVWEALPQAPALLLRAAEGMQPEMVGRFTAAVKDTQAGLTLESGKPTIVEDHRSGRRFVSGLGAENGMASGASVVIDGREVAYGVLSAHAAARRRFTEEEVSFMQSVANVLAEAIERRRAEEESRHRALHDPLTELPNRTLFYDRLQGALDRIGRRPSTVAVLYLDIDNFKLVNDTFGHGVGDNLLEAVALRLQTALRAKDTLARIGGDEFAVICDEMEEPHDAVRVAERFDAAMSRPFVVAGGERTVSASVGIALASAPHQTPGTLLRDADTAMYRAKESGGARYELFDERLRERMLERVETETALRAAVERDELRVLYQPIVSLADGGVRGVEALLRWERPGRGLVSPADFVPLAEASGLIVPIGRWVLDESCRQAVKWQQRHDPSVAITVSVNVSARQFAECDFVATVTGALASAGARPEQLVLELTESTLIEASQSTLAAISELRELGVTFLLDDFGTGYSSLSYLERFPLDGLKIDRSFVTGLAERPESRAIFGAIVEMANALKMDVVAEGIETKEQLSAVRSLGCRISQGYYFARPLPPSDIDHMLQRTAAPARA